ncbi:MAG: ATP-binding protein, partial [Lachnospiraceae bacterium]|nr:ATP-binding protein [Lachnospiraceae bacterium]
MLVRKLKKFLRKLKSIRFLVFIIILFVGLISCMAMHYGIMESYEERAVSLRTSDVQNQLKVIGNHLLANNYLEDSSSDVINAELDQLSDLYDGRVLIINRNFKIVKDTYGLSAGKTIVAEEVIRCFRGETISKYDDKNGYIELTIPLTRTKPIAMPGGEETYAENVIGVMLTSVSTETIRQTMEIMSEKALIMEAMVIIIVFAVAFSVAALLSGAFNKVTGAVNKVKEGHSDEQVELTGIEETDQIVEAFNRMLVRMKTLDDSRQEFVANVSHELKTPLTSMKVLSDALLMQPDAPAELYQEFMQDLSEEIDRENQIINDLLSLVRMDKTAAVMNVKARDINELLELILKRLRPIARKNNVEVILESIRPVTAEIDEVKFTQAISNLVENAIKYNHENGNVKVTLDADHQAFSVEISDNGIGMPKEALEHIYERFYRVDKSHSREIGGTGLGLAITKNAILLHKGTIKAESVEGEGTTFVVRIPLSYI